MRFCAAVFKDMDLLTLSASSCYNTYFDEYKLFVLDLSNINSIL